jgi:trimethylamine:corrinoid methyltransferase-like protein
MKPVFQLLSENAIDTIITQALELIKTVGISVEANDVSELLMQHGASKSTDEKRVLIGEDLVERSLQSAPSEFSLYDRNKREVARPGSDSSCFIPGSAALNLFDFEQNKARPSNRKDLDDFARLTDQLDAFPIQSTAIVPADVPAEVADRVRLFHALKGCSKPIVTGTFHETGFEPMVKMLETVRGSSQELADFPLAVFDCCPTPPLQWPGLTSAVLVEAARRGIPAEIVPVPLCGATGPVTLHGALVQIVAENFSGIVINQCASAESPVIWGGCPMSFDMRFGTTPTGAPETMLLNGASTQIGRHLGLPTHGYLTLSDSKIPDMQSGFESGLGALTAALSGMNMISGAGMLNFIGCQSYEKLVFDAQIALATQRYRQGITIHENPKFANLFLEAIEGKGFLSLKHTRKNHRSELLMPNQLIDRSGDGSAITDAYSRCHQEVQDLLKTPQSERLSAEVESELGKILASELKRF